MLTMHPTLLVGPADWDEARLPREEFSARIAAFWRACDPAIAGAVVFGSPRDHAELAYLTHVTPKLEDVIALIPRDGAPRLLVGGGTNMLGAAKPLTFIETLAPLRDAGAAIARWRDEVGRLALVNGDAMPFGLRQEIAKALGAPPFDATAVVTAAMRRKSPREVALIGAACAGLEAAFSAMREAQRAGQGMTDTVLAGEQAAWRGGAQDVRALFGREGRLAPFTVRDEAPADPLQVYLAVRHDGYWAEGFAVLSGGPPPVAASARALLDEALQHAKPGAAYRGVAEILGRAAAGRPHPLTARDCGGAIGLAVEEPGCLTAAGAARFAPGEVFSIRAGLRAGGDSAVVSAIVAITETGHEVLWPGGATP